MTKKHFIALADVIRREQGQNARFSAVQLETLAGFCAEQNPRFNRHRWLSYIAGQVGPSGGAVKQAKGGRMKKKPNKQCEGCGPEGNQGWRINQQNVIERCEYCRLFRNDSEAVDYIRSCLTGTQVFGSRVEYAI